MLLVGFPVHEFTHAFAAYRLGDGTAKLFGRLTLNPIVHFDPVGGLLLAVIVHRVAAARSCSAGRSRRRSTRRTCEGGRSGEAIVAAAGPLSNLVLALVGAIPLRFVLANAEIRLDAADHRRRCSTASCRSTSS